MDVFYLLLGIAGLWLASEIAIGGAMEIAERYRISRAFLGLTVLAVGTDVPELFVNISGAISTLRGVDTSSLIIGQTVGTSFGQSGLMLGLAGLFGLFTLSKRQLMRDGLLLIFSAVVLLLLSLDGHLSRIDGAIMIIIYLAYFASLLREEKIRERVHISVGGSRGNSYRSLLAVVSGLVLLGFSAEMTVSRALALSEAWGVSQSVIGALIIGLGTSLPEFATSATAIRMGQKEMALGNLLGSTIFDILLALGSAAVISGLAVASDLIYLDMLMLVVLTVIIFVTLGTRLRLGRREAMFLIAAFLIYVAAKLAETVYLK